jgi:GWxTD domain-containing protein
MQSKSIMFGFLLCALAVSVLAQEQQRVNVCFNSQTTYQQWLERDVLYIITSEEKEAFLKLKTDEDREQFIKNFWARRDPDPDTEENEYREEYYTRIAYANEHLSTKTAVALLTPGWKTDRGKTYIMLGIPKKIEKGEGEFEGMQNVLYEKWFYKNIPGLPGNIEIVFIDLAGKNEFRFLLQDRERILDMLSPKGLTITSM